MNNSCSAASTDEKWYILGNEEECCWHIDQSAD